MIEDVYWCEKSGMKTNIKDLHEKHIENIIRRIEQKDKSNLPYGITTDSPIYLQLQEELRNRKNKDVFYTKLCNNIHYKTEGFYYTLS